VGGELQFATLLALRPNAFDSIWLAMSRVRRGLDGRAALEQGVAKLKDGEWPTPIMLHLLGRLYREALDAAAARDEKKRRGQECEARFYAAERYIAEGRRDDARPLLETARDQCPQNFVEYEAALMELAKPR
jgi:lipoprotein NlpI